MKQLRNPGATQQLEAGQNSTASNQRPQPQDNKMLLRQDKQLECL